MLGYSAGATHRLITRKKQPSIYRAPSFMDANTGTFGQPRPFADAAAKRIIDSATHCYVVEYEGAANPSLGYLDAGIALAEDIVAQCGGGAIVDETADLYLTRRALARLKKKGVSVRETVSLREIKKGQKVTIASQGMSKFGQRDFVVTVPEDIAEVGRRLLYDNLCSYSMSRPVRAGETFGGNVMMTFVEDDQGRLEVRDVRPGTKKAMPTMNGLVEALRTLWRAQRTAERSRKSAAPASPKEKTRSKNAAPPPRRAAVEAVLNFDSTKRISSGELRNLVKMLGDDAVVLFLKNRKESQRFVSALRTIPVLRKEVLRHVAYAGLEAIHHDDYREQAVTLIELLFDLEPKEPAGKSDAEYVAWAHKINDAIHRTFKYEQYDLSVRLAEVGARHYQADKLIPHNAACAFVKAKRYDEAIDMCRAAVKMKYGELKRMKVDRDLKPLFKRPDFQALFG